MIRVIVICAALMAVGFASGCGVKGNPVPPPAIG